MGLITFDKVAHLLSLLLSQHCKSIPLCLFPVHADVPELLDVGGRFSWDVPMPGELDDMPAALMMQGGFGRAAARRILYRPGASAATAGVWDDSEPTEPSQDALNGSKHFTPLLLQHSGFHYVGLSISASLLLVSTSTDGLTSQHLACWRICSMPPSLAACNFDNMYLFSARCELEGIILVCSGPEKTCSNWPSC